MCFWQCSEFEHNLHNGAEKNEKMSHKISSQIRIKISYYKTRWKLQNTQKGKWDYFKSENVKFCQALVECEAWAATYFVNLAMSNRLRPFPFLRDWFTDCRTISWFYSAQRLDLFAWCVRLSRPLVGFRTHFKSLHFHSLISFNRLAFASVPGAATGGGWVLVTSLIHQSSLSSRCNTPRST